MTSWVIDENILIIANSIEKTPQADGDCQSACIDLLSRIVKRGMLVVDNEGKVLQIYRNSVDPRGQPGVGDAFLKFAIDNRFNNKKVRQVSLELNEDGNFTTFPSSEELTKFDRSDRIYVALVLADQSNSRIANAVDSDYSEFQSALNQAGVEVEELCPHCLK